MPSPSLLRRFLYNTAGGIALLLGLLGVFLPLLPTTPFILLASACFMRGSPRIAQWMLHNQLFGHYLQDYYAHRGIPLKTKIWAISIMWVSLALSAYFMPIVWARFLLLIPGGAVTVYLWRYKTKPSSPAHQREHKQ